MQRWRHETLPSPRAGLGGGGRPLEHADPPSPEPSWRTINDAIERLADTVRAGATHADTELPADARQVRLLRYTMPAADGS